MREKRSGQRFGLFIYVHRPTSKQRKKSCVGQEMRTFRVFLAALFSSTNTEETCFFLLKQ